MRSPDHGNFTNCHFFAWSDDLDRLDVVVLQRVVPHDAGFKVHGDVVDEGGSELVEGQPMSNLGTVGHFKDVGLEPDWDHFFAELAIGLGDCWSGACWTAGDDC